MFKKKHLLVLAAWASSDPKQSSIFSLKVHRMNVNNKKGRKKIFFCFYFSAYSFSTTPRRSSFSYLVFRATGYKKYATNRRQLNIIDYEYNGYGMEKMRKKGEKERHGKEVSRDFLSECSRKKEENWSENEKIKEIF